VFELIIVWTVIKTGNTVFESIIVFIIARFSAAPVLQGRANH
jgi:hypothetical protein